MREMLLATLRRAEAAEGGGEGGGQGGGKSDNRAKMAQTLSTYAKVCKCEAEQRAFLQRLPPPAPQHRAPPPPPYPRPAAPHLDSLSSSLSMFCNQFLTPLPPIKNLFRPWSYMLLSSMHP